MTSPSDVPHDSFDLVSDAWHHVSGIVPDVDAHFVEQGGSSLYAARMLAQIEATSGVRVDLAEFFQKPTAEALALLVHARRPALTSVDRPELTAGRREELDHSPLTFTQKQIYIADRLCGTPSPYVLGFVAYLPRPAERSRVIESLRHVTRRHPILRCGFDFDAGGELEMALHDSDARIADQPCDTDYAIWARNLMASIDIGDTDPPVLWGLSGCHGGLVEKITLIAHHALIDLRSWLTLNTEILALLEGRALGPQPASFLQFAAVEDRRNAELEGSEVVSHTAGEYRGSRRNGAALRYAFEVDPRIAGVVRERSQSLGHTEFVGTLACLAVAFSDRQTSLSVASSNRPGNEYEATVGCFVGTADVATALEESTFDDAVGLLHDRLLVEIGAHTPRASPAGAIVVSLIDPPEGENHMRYQELAPMRGKYEMRVEVRSTEEEGTSILLEAAEPFSPHALDRLKAAFSVWPLSGTAWSIVEREDVTRPGDWSAEIRTVPVESVVIEPWGSGVN